MAGGTVAAKTVTDHSFTLGSLNFGSVYYWKVDEVNTVTYPGDVWSFTTQEYAAIDDFEIYNDNDNRIYDAWIDGYTDGNSGSVVGNMTAPFAEQTIIHGGKQSMPFEYNNVNAPLFGGLADLRGDPELDIQRRRRPCWCTSAAGRRASPTMATTPLPSVPAAPTLGRRRSVPLRL